MPYRAALEMTCLKTSSFSVAYKNIIKKCAISLRFQSMLKQKTKDYRYKDRFLYWDTLFPALRVQRIPEECDVWIHHSVYTQKSPARIKWCFQLTLGSSSALILVKDQLHLIHKLVNRERAAQTMNVLSKSSVGTFMLCSVTWRCGSQLWAGSVLPGFLGC